MIHSTDHCACSGGLNRRQFFKITGFSTAAGVLFSPWTLSGFAAERTPEQRANRLAELMDERWLFDRGARRVYRGANLTAISLPLGGVAAGPIQINGEARRHIWQIFRNYKAINLPDSFFAVRAQAGQAAPVVRALQTVAEGPFTAMKALSFSGEYPFGWYSFEEPALPVQVSMEVFSPLIPLNTKDSSIPCAIFNLTAENTGKEPVDVSFLATQQNPIGYQLPNLIKGIASKTYGGNINTVVREGGATLLHLHSNRPVTDGTHGDLALGTPDAKAVACTSWTAVETLAERFLKDGSVEESNQAGPTAEGLTTNAAIAVPFVLKPGEKRTVTFVLAWHFTNTRFKADKMHVGNMYANWWPDALSVARDVVQRLEPLTTQTRLYNETLYKTNLPYWMLDRISSQVAILSSMSCHWAKDGFFYAFEGCNEGNGCCEGNATHVWGYPQAHARLFPEIARRMREQQLTLAKPDGMIPVRFVGWGDNFMAFDGMCHEVTAVLREHQTNTDPAWLARQWPDVKKSLDYMIQRWDADGDGMLSGPQHAMDGDHGGTTSWLGSTYLCALAAAAKMADIQNDAAAKERYGNILASGRVNQDKALFNGEYYIQVPDPVPRHDYLTGCYIDQMLGQWWALQVNLGWLYPPEHVRAAMASLFKYNFHTDFHGFTQVPRVFCADDDAGMIQGTWPQGGRPKPPHVIMYTEEIMSGFEYTAACLMVNCGLLREGFTVLRAAADRYDGRLRVTPNPNWKQYPGFSNWGYTGNPFGDDECGKFYVRAMAIWGVLVASQGFTYDSATDAIGFAPLWKPEDHVSFFTAAEGWGLFRQTIDDKRQRAEIEVAHGRLRIRTITLATAKKTANVLLNGQPIASSSRAENGQLWITLSTPVIIEVGQSMEMSLA